MENTWIDFSAGDFPTVAGFPHITQQAVMPVIAYRVKGEQITEVRPLGTCFSISSHGLALTARHVVDEALNLGHWTASELPTPNEEWWLGAVYICDPGPDDNFEGLFGGLLPARKVHMSGDLDIAVISLDLPIHVASGEHLRIPRHRLRIAFPEVGSVCFGLGYRRMKSDLRPNVRIVAQRQSYSATRGTVEEVHFPRRDNGMLPFPCFRTSARFDPGMSGGPVFGTDGNVFGVICSAQKTHRRGGYISYASLIAPALLIPVEAARETGQTEEVFLYDFTGGGSVLLDDTAANVRFRRDGQRLTMDFGIPPTITNELTAGA